MEKFSMNIQYLCSGQICACEWCLLLGSFAPWFWCLEYWGFREKSSALKLAKLLTYDYRENSANSYRPLKSMKLFAAWEGFLMKKKSGSFINMKCQGGTITTGKVDRSDGKVSILPPGKLR